MTQDRKLLLIMGATLIALLVAIASFSLGVYAGVHGWTAGPPSVAGPGAKPARPPDPGAAPPAGPAQQPPDQAGPRPQLVGQVRSVSGRTITLDAAQGPRLFQLGDSVQVFRREQGREELASLDEVVPGEHLAVFGHFEGDGGKQLVAERLVLLPPPDRQP